MFDLGACRVVGSGAIEMVCLAKICVFECFDRRKNFMVVLRLI